MERPRRQAARRACQKRSVAAASRALVVPVAPEAPAITVEQLTRGRASRSRGLSGFLDPKGAIGSRTGLTKSTPASPARAAPSCSLQNLGLHLLDEAGFEIAELERPEREADQTVHLKPEVLEDAA